MVRTNEGGSILSFIVVGGILAVLLVGGVYAVRQHFDNGQAVARKPVAPTSTQSPAPDRADDSSKTNEGQTSSGSDASPSSSTDQAATPSTSTAPSDATPSTAGGAPSAELPHTGPIAVLVNVLAIGLLSSLSVAYIRSRRLPISL